MHDVQCENGTYDQKKKNKKKLTKTGKIEATTTEKL